MNRWAEAAYQGGNVEEACKAANVTLREYRDGRRLDLDFNEECRAYDQTVDLRISDSTRIDAVKGDARSRTLYYNRVRDLFLGSAEDLKPDQALTMPGVAEAMIDAGLRKIDANLNPPPDDPSLRREPPSQPPCPSSSQLAARPSPKPKPKPKPKSKSRPSRSPTGGASNLTP